MNIYKDIKSKIKKKNLSLYTRLRRHKKIIKFFLSGTIAVTIDFSVLIILTHYYEIWPVYSSSIAYATSFFVGFYLQKLWTFRDTSNKRLARQIFLYFMVAVINLTLNAFIMYTLVEYYEIHYILSQVISGSILAGLTFLMYSYVIFKKIHRKRLKKFQKNILLVAGIYPPDPGGPAYYVRRIAKLLPERGYNVKVISFGQDDYMSYDRQITIISRQHNVFVRYLKFWLVIRKHRKWARIVYSYDLFSTGLPAALVRLFSSDLQLVIRLGGDFIWEKALENGWTDLPLKKYYQSAKNNKERIHILVAKFVLAMSDWTFFTSDLQRRVFEKFYKPDNTGLIENAYPEAQEYELKNNNRIFLACRFIRMKNLERLLEAINMLPGVELDLYGEGPLENRLKKYVKDHGLNDRVRIYPKLKQEELFEKLSESRFVVLPSITDISPNLALECVKIGKPILLTRECGFRGRFQGKMKYIDPFDVDGIVEAIKDMYDPIIYNKYLSDIQSIQLDRSYDDIVREHDELFNKLLS